MTVLLTRTIRQAGIIAALVISLCAFSTSSFAFSTEAQQMCTSDAFPPLQF